MNNKYNKKLEYNKILESLSTFCDTTVGKTLALNLTPSNDTKVVQNLLLETDEAVNLTYRASTPSFYDFENINKFIKIIEAEGILSIKALLELNKIFSLANSLKKYFNQDFLNKEENPFPLLSNLFEKLYTNSSVTEKISSILLDENTIDDRASNTLNSIRQRQRKLEQQIKNTLNGFIHKPSYSKYIQENIITIRNDRFVVPIKEEYRSQIKGFVHDISNAGSTVFIEPTIIFDLNNELNNLKIEEEIEIEKILKELSKLFYPYKDELILDTELIGKLDFIFAKAKYSKNIKGITPKINNKKEINLIKARHPLIDSKSVIPISVSLGKNFKSLVITGPNTGGKTVSLKTIGLLELMACSGLNIPADENSSIYVFDQIFADIGDNQSIVDSLSTFSSHILNIVDIVNSATSHSLVLVDELGSGTDPLEGANLAISILEYLYKNNSLVVATTHYQELKNYALSHDGFENACVEFDLSTLSPTYNLLIGIPGKSNAFEISQKLGLPKKIIERAKNLMSSDDIHIEELLKNIYDNKIKIEKDKLEAEENSKRIEELRLHLEKDSFALQEKESEIINKAKVKARNLLLDTKEEVDDIIRQANSASSKDLNSLRNDLNKNIKSLSTSGKNITKKSNTYNKLLKSDIHQGLEVFVNTVGKPGIIISNVSKDNEVQVQIGIIKMNVSVESLSLTEHHTSKNQKSSVSYANPSKIQSVSTELNIIGMNVEEALPIVDKFLDDATIAKLQTVRIVHGKGTGKLRSGIHKFLKKNAHVESYRLGTFGEGEAGVTVVELK